MDKLLQLLNEYLWQSGIVAIDQEIEWGRDIFFENVDWFHAEEAEIISKKFWFIQWLVEKRKVEWFLIPEIIKNVEVDSSGLHDYNEYYENWESLLMHLSIQDDPIEFLVSVLK